MVKFFLLLLLITAPLARAGDDVNDVFLVGFGDVPDEFQNCVLNQHRSADECDPAFLRTREALSKVQEAIDPGLRANGRDGIDVALPYVEKRPWYAQAGVHLGAEELTIDELRRDPIRRKVEDKKRELQATSGTWVRHTIEIHPRLSAGYQPDRDGPIAVNSLLLGFLPQFSIRVTVVKHYDLPLDFPTRPRERIAELKRLFGESVKHFIRLPSEFSGKGLKPGESLTLESYLSASGLPTIASQFTSFPISTFWLSGFTRVGFEYFQTVRYRRYTVQKDTDDHHVRVLLETPQLKRWGPYADVGVVADLGFINLETSPIRAGYRWISEKNLATEYNIDLSSPEAIKALNKAYLWGDFSPADKLAEEDCAAFTGVEKSSVTDSKGTGLGGHAHGWRIKVLKWVFGNTSSRTDSITTPMSCAGNGEPVKAHVDEVQKVRGTLRASRLFTLGVRTVGDGHSLWMKFNFTGKHASRNELLEFLRVARAIADPSDSANQQRIRQVADTIESTPDGNPLGHVNAYLSIELDATALATILDMSEAERQASFTSAWNHIIGVDSGETLADTNEYKDHLKALVKFLAAAKNGIAQPNDLKETKKFLSGVEKTGIDLYPFAAMLGTLPNGDHTLATAQIYLAGKTRDGDRLIDPVHVGSLFDENAAPVVQGAIAQ